MEGRSKLICLMRSAPEDHGDEEEMVEAEAEEEEEEDFDVLKNVLSRFPHKRFTIYVTTTQFQ